MTFTYAKVPWERTRRENVNDIHIYEKVIRHVIRMPAVVIKGNTGKQGEGKVNRNLTRQIIVASSERLDRACSTA